MNIWILILTLSSTRHPTTVVVEFYSKSSCEKAIEDAKSDYYNARAGVAAFCVKK